MPLKQYADLASTKLAFAYADLEPGEVLVFSKRTLHMSDPRPHVLADLRARFPDRLAVSVRAAVVARDAAGGVPFWPSHSWTSKLATDQAWADAWMAGGAKVDGGYRLHVGSRHDWLMGIPRTPGPWQPPDLPGAAPKGPPPSPPPKGGGAPPKAPPPAKPGRARPTKRLPRGEGARLKAEMEAQGLVKPVKKPKTAEELAQEAEWTRISAMPPESPPARRRPFLFSRARDARARARRVAGGDELYDDALTEFTGVAIDRFAGKYSPEGGPFSLNPP